MTPFRAIARDIAKQINNILPDSPKYTFRYGTKYLGLINLKSELNRCTQGLDIDTIYDDVVKHGVGILLTLPFGKRAILKQYCESVVSIGVTKQLILEGQNIELGLPDDQDNISLRDMLCYIFHTINTELYTIAIDYINGLKGLHGNKNASQEVKLLRIGQAFGELEGSEGLPEDMKELIFNSGISTTLTNIIEMIGLKMKTVSGFDRGLLGSLINKNQGYWNDSAKSNIPMEYIMQGLGYEGAGDFRTKNCDSQSLQGEEYLYDFEDGSMRIFYAFSERDFRRFVRRGRKAIQKKGANIYVGCPLLYEVDDESQSNMIIALQNMMLSKVLEGLGEYYSALENQT
ncbi:hypothetical protein N9J72_01505 [Candidatus Gracilibacteria bacterium]|nr:hypothetical protein [Candidatus Gracilibacteria bacterium]